MRCTTEEAEHWTLVYDIKMAWEIEARRIRRVEVNYLTTVKWIKGVQDVVKYQVNLNTFKEKKIK